MRLHFLTALFLLVFSMADAQDVKVMSYNMRVDFGGDGENNWQFRREFFSDQINYNAPDFVGTQEGRLNQLQYLDTALVNYARIGRGRDNSETQGEYSALFYNKKRFRLLSQNTFWLSEAPEVPESKSWETAYPRICTYGLFEDLKTKKRLYFFNTHLDHISEPARENGTKLILKRISEINTKLLPVILTGDFNSEMTTGAYRTIVSQMSDARKISKTKAFGPSGTFNDFKHDKPVTLLLDYIFVSRNNVEVSKFAVLSDSKDCKYPSDHLPVLAEIKLK